MKAKIYNFAVWIDGNVKDEVLVNKLNYILKVSEFNVLNYIEHKFEPHGLTSLWLLAESHLAIHTFPEHNKIYLELSSCNKEKEKIFKKVLEEEFTFSE